MAKKNFLKHTELKAFLDEKVEEFNHIDFIVNDPISLPHQFSTLQDREIIGFWVAMLSWGLRKTIINNGQKLIELMDGAPYDFILNHQEKDRKRFLDFKHRTFNDIDALYFLEYFQQYYKNNSSLEDAFMMESQAFDLEASLIQFHNQFFDLPDSPKRTRKHVANPAKKSTAKRINMFLRWMVRQDKKGVDFGVWKKIPTSELMIPLDVHVDKVARKLGLLKRKQTDWQSVKELTENLRKFDPKDPVKYDYALFGIGILDKNKKQPS